MYLCKARDFGSRIDDRTKVFSTTSDRVHGAVRLATVHTHSDLQSSGSESAIGITFFASEFVIQNSFWPRSEQELLLYNQSRLVPR